MGVRVKSGQTCHTASICSCRKIRSSGIAPTRACGSVSCAGSPLGLLSAEALLGQPGVRTTEGATPAPGLHLLLTCHVCGLATGSGSSLMASVMCGATGSSLPPHSEHRQNKDGGTPDATTGLQRQVHFHGASCQVTQEATSLLMALV